MKFKFCIMFSLIILMTEIPLLAVRECEIGLADAEQIAVENNFELKSIRSEMAMHNEAVKGKLRDHFPSASISYKHGRSIAERDLDSNSHTVQVSLTQPIFDSGRRNLSYEIGKINHKLALEKYRNEKNNLRFRIRKSYMDVQHKRENLTLIHANLENAKKLLIKSEKEKKLGIITEIDYLEIKNEFNRRKLVLSQSNAEMSDAINDFYFILNAGDNYRAKIKHSDLYGAVFYAVNKSESELVETAMQNRIDLKETILSTSRAKKEYLLAKYSSLPVISLTGHYGKSGEKWPPEGMEWGLGVNISFSVLGNSITNDVSYKNSRGGATKGYSTGSTLNIYDDPSWRQSRMEKELSLKRNKRKQYELYYSIETTIPKLLRNLDERKKSLELSDEIVAIQERRYEIEKKKFTMGDISLHDYFREELKLNENRLKLLQERIGFILNAGQLELETGMELDSLHLFDLKENCAADADKPLNHPAWKPKTKIYPALPIEIFPEKSK